MKHTQHGITRAAKMYLLGAIAWSVVLCARAEGPSNGKAVIYTTDRRAIECYVTRSDSRGVFWNLSNDDDHAAYLPFTQIVTIRFPVPEKWEEATEAFNDEDFKTARRFLAIIRKQEERFATAPGNFSTRAHFLQLSSYRKRGQLKELADHIEGFDPKLLDKQFRMAGELLYVWAAIARNQWDEAVTLLDYISSQKLLSSVESELWFLRGLTFVRQGKMEEGLDDFARVFTVGYGTNRMVERAALQRAIEQLSKLERFDEVKGLINLYKANYGKGELWKNADINSLLPPEKVNPPPTTPPA